MLNLSLCISLLSQGAALPEAASLLDRREASLGTREARERVRGLVLEGEVDMAGAVAGRFEELHLVQPGGERVLLRFHMEGCGTTTQGTDGTVSWTSDTGFGIDIQEGPEQMPLRRMWAARRSAPWRSLYASARTLGVVERDGRALYELEMQPQEGRPERWFLDRTTNELARVSLAFPAPAGEPTSAGAISVLPMEWVLEDWRAVDGVLYPHRIVQEVLGGTPIEAAAKESVPLMRVVSKVTSIRHEALDPARIAPPPEVAEAIRDPKKRTPRPAADPSACTLETVAQQPVASVRLEIDATKVSEALSGALTEIMRAITEQKAEMTGPPFSRYHVIDTKKNRIDLEAGMPVRAPIRPSGRVKPSELPAGRVAMTWHVGSYHQLQQSYDRLGAWMKAENLRARGGFWEVYWTDPGLEPDPSTWRTQILWPVE